MLQEYIESLCENTLIALYQDCEQLSNTGILPMDAAIRQMLKAKALDDNLLTLTLASSAIYRTLATKYVKGVIE
jgi:hypothetical protein